MSTISSTKRSSLASVSSLDEVTKTKSSSNRPVSSIELTNSNFNSKLPAPPKRFSTNIENLIQKSRPNSILVKPETIKLNNFSENEQILPSNDDTISSDLGSISEIISEIEKLIAKAKDPIELELDDSLEEIEVNGERGFWTNKSESINWKGSIPLKQYQINQDLNPLIITKNPTQNIEYSQNFAIRYLRPPTPPLPGEIVIKQLPNEVSPPGPPIILRQQPPRPQTPEPIVVRERPPNPPEQVGRKVITISGKKLPPPPRKVVIERLAPLPSKPQSVIIERWLPYAQSKRRVIYNKPSRLDPIVMPSKNVNILIL
jgi:hypothetical protein